MMLVLAPMDHIMNQIFKVKYKRHASWIDFEIGNIFKKWNKKRIDFDNWFWKDIEFKLSEVECGNEIYFRNNNLSQKELGLDVSPYISVIL